MLTYSKHGPKIAHSHWIKSHKEFADNMAQFEFKNLLTKIHYSGNEKNSNSKHLVRLKNIGKKLKFHDLKSRLLALIKEL